MRIGTGVARTRSRTKARKPSKRELIAPEDGEDTWSDIPTLRNQFLEHPNTVKFGPIQTEVFYLKPDDDKELDRLNELMSQTAPPEGPGIYVVDTKEHFSEKSDAWVMLVRFQKLRYKVLIK